MVFHITFMLTLFHDKKCCNFINLFPCILWALIAIGLVLSWWRLLKKMISRLGSRVVQPMKGHVRSICQKLKSQCISWVISRLRQPARWPARCMTDSWDFECDSYTLHSYYIYPHYLQNYKETTQKRTLERGFTNTLHFRESYSSSRDKSL